MILAITGTPGVGKTAVSRILAKRLGYALLDLNRAVRAKRLYSGYDKERKSYIAAEKAVERYVRGVAKSNRNLIVDGHLSHILPRSLVDVVIVLRCEPTELSRRLRRKGWPAKKIRENAEAELIGLISYEARNHRKVVEIDTTHATPQKAARSVIAAVKGRTKPKPIDWLLSRRAESYIKTSIEQ